MNVDGPADAPPAPANEPFISGPPPLLSVTNALIGINVAVFVAMGLFAGAGWLTAGDLTPFIHYGANNAAATTDGQWWRLLTSMFLHYGLLHLALNMWALYQAGYVLERFQGRALYLLTYMASGIGGGFLSMLWHGDKMWSAGASGAIFGVYGALLGYMLRERRAFPQAVIARMIRSTVMFAGYNLVYGAVRTGIDNGAHVGGLAAGLALGWLTAPPRDAASRARDGARRIALGLGFVALMIVAGVATAPRFDYSVQEELAWNRVIKDLGDREHSIIEKQNTALRTWEQTHGGAEALTAVISGQAVPFYTDLDSKLAAIDLKPGGGIDRQRRMLREFTRLRLEGYRHLLAAVAFNSAQELNAYVGFEARASAASRGLGQKP